MLPPTESAPAPAAPSPHGPFAALRRMVPKSEVIRYLFVGGFNTVFALALYALFVHLFGRTLPPSRNWLIADLAHVTSTPIGITVAFLCYKHFVFQTKGNYVKEWLRCFAVYSISFPVGLLVLPVATQAITALMHSRTYAPYLAGLVNSAIIATYSYFGHKRFSFKK
jgi:putative flippase GtrA